MPLSTEQIAKIGVIGFIALAVSIAIGTAVSFFAVMFAWAFTLTLLTIKSKYPVYELEDITYVVAIFAIFATAKYPNSNLVNGILTVIALAHAYLVFRNNNFEFDVSDFF